MSRTILIVDDSFTERVVLKGFLKAEYELIEAASGEEALEILRQKFRRISAVVLDVIMPGIDGFETLKLIKSNAVWLQIPVIITTALDDDASREKAVSCGADNFITKPFNRKLLLHVVHNAILLRETAAIANTLWRDNLTGLLNRESFYKEAARMIRRQEEGFFQLSIFDVENFKVINDQHGTEIGDEVLKHIANRLNAFATNYNGLACRYMGDKFAVIYPARLRDSDAIKGCYQQMITPACLSRPIRIRVGRYLVTDCSLPVSAMYDRASMAEGSIRGRFDVFYAEYTASMRDELLRQQEIVNDMVGALQNGEFEPWFQPQYNHATGALIGAEALVRWRRDGRIVPPGSFIPVFEKNGFIYEVDQSIWRQVCAYLRRWLDEGKNPLPVSVNISRYDLYQQDFLEVICGLIREFNLPAELLRLEITESALADNTRVITGIVGQLMARGFTVEIDDFGSGYSSLNTLKDVPASILKLDMRFFEITENSQRGGNIVESVVRMAKWLGMTVIAEGVEDKEQADYLKTIGCYYIQGYFYAKPMTVDEYEQRMTRSSAEPSLSQMETLASLDNNLFWDPKSMETLIFNSYVGGACIFEYHRGLSELLRVNDQYISELHGLIPAGAELRNSSFVPFVDRAGWDMLIRTLQTAAEQKKEASCEVRLTNGSQTEYIRFTTRVIASTTERIMYYAVIVNMTEQREAERKQTESAEQLHAIVDNINGGVSAVYLKGDTPAYMIINDKYFEIIGYTREQFAAEVKNILDIVHPDDRERVEKLVRETAQSEKPFTMEYRIIRRNGAVRHILCNTNVMHLLGVDEPVQLAVSNDITVLRWAEQQYHETMDRLQTVMNAMPNGLTAVAFHGDHTEFLFANDRYYEMHGISKDLGEQNEIGAYLELVHSDDRASLRNMVMSLTGIGQSAEAEYRVRRTDGTIRWTKAVISVTSLVGVAVPVQVAIFTDISAEKAVYEQLCFFKEQKNTSRQQMEYEYRQTQLLDNLPFGAALFRLDGEQLTAVHINKQYIKMVNCELNYALEDFKPMDFIHPDDRQLAFDAIKDAIARGQNGSCEVRLLYGGEEYRLFRLDANIMPDVNGTYLLFVAYTRITEQEEKERLAEEEYRLAALHSNRTICRYNIAEQTLTVAAEDAARLALPECLTDVPYGRVKLGRISEETKDVYIAFYESIRNGAREAAAVFRKLLNSGWRWLDARATTVFNSAGQPVSAIISYTDVTEQREKEAIYSYWQNSLTDRPEDSYTLFRCNLNKGSSFESWSGKLLDVAFADARHSFDELTGEYIEQCVYADDRERYRALLHADTMLAEYHRGHRIDTIEYREQKADGRMRWLKLTVNLVEYPDSNDVGAYLLFENIDEQKRTELRNIKRAETDPLTGILNRAAFATKVNQAISQSGPGAQHALLMLDVDNFKQVNDIFGHGVGDQALTDIADLLTKSSRKDDLVGRLGGDEFLVFLADIPNEAAAATKARQLCKRIRKTFSLDVQISSSIGIALYPRDGEGFETLYKVADDTLYRVKDIGKNGYAFSHGEPVSEAAAEDRLRTIANV